MERHVSKCPACHENDFEITKLRCKACGTAIEGHFSISRMATLTKEQLAFVEVFVKCRGSIKDVEKELGISYPTVRGKLDKVIEAMGYEEQPVTRKRKAILEALDKKEISTQDALKALQNLKQ